MCSVIVSVCSDNGICTIPMGSETDRKPYCVCDEQWIGPGCQFARPRPGGGDPHLETLDGKLNQWLRKVVSHVVLQDLATTSLILANFSIARALPTTLEWTLVSSSTPERL